MRFFTTVIAVTALTASAVLAAPFDGAAHSHEAPEDPHLHRRRDSQLAYYARRDFDQLLRRGPPGAPSTPPPYPDAPYPYTPPAREQRPPPPGEGPPYPQSDSSRPPSPSAPPKRGKKQGQKAQTEEEPVDQSQLDQADFKKQLKQDRKDRKAADKAAGVGAKGPSFKAPF
ncbi:hypothetical protein EIP91_000392 [Steccherinum ochraceum]|uniref:Uncharacterized protein n=1 Tax=Steccherinum ochraceum TaxID=92696 RepID=A0A4R0RIC1_9APHY|nr:hypothetical protein EIP91_000392 [Steccherinum ochraceum]